MPRIDHNARRRARHGNLRTNGATPRTTREVQTGREKDKISFKGHALIKKKESPTDSMRARSVGRVVLAGPKEPRKPTTTKTPEKTMKVGKPGYNRKTVEVKDKAPQAKRKRRGPPGKRR